MIVQDVNYRVSCDMPNCRKEAFIKIEKNGFFKSAGVFLCKDCMNELYENLAQRIVPKSLDHMLNKKVVTKRIKNNEK